MGSVQRVGRAAQETATGPAGDGSLTVHGDRESVSLPAVVDKIHTGLVRIDRAPTSGWSAEDVMSVEEAEVLFNQAHLGETVIMVTGWYAREVLDRFPAPLVEHPFLDGDRINEYFTAGPPFGTEPDRRGRQVINRALANPGKMVTHPELDDLDDDQLLLVWLAVVYWFAIKSVALNAWTDRASAHA